MSRTEAARDAGTVVAAAMTALFVPGDRPDRFAKAAASGADLVIIDLEDAVASADKSAARAAAIEALQPIAELQALVRINAPATDLGAADLDALIGLTSRLGHGLLGVMVPKAADPVPIAAVVAAVQPLAVVALVESARGIDQARALAAVPGVTRLAFGALDFALDIGADPEALTGQIARAEVVIASRVAGLPAPLESPSTDLNDAAGIAASTRAARVLGFGGRLCIHPGQLAPVRAGFAPSQEEITWARRIVGTGDSAARVDDQMVDRPVLDRARQILLRAGERA